MAMKANQKLVILAGTTLLCLSTAGQSARGNHKSEAGSAPLSTPRTITLQPTGLAQGYSLNAQSSALLPREKIVYADAKGRTLYTSRSDKPGKSDCIDECAKIWIPCINSDNAAAFGDWSVIKRSDGTKQWALGGKPLYTYIKDTDPGSIAGNSPRLLGRGPNVGMRGTRSGSNPPDALLPDGWDVAYMYPVSASALPTGFRIAEVEDAHGLVVQDYRNRTTYGFIGNAEKLERICPRGVCNEWLPVRAPLLAQAWGKFAFDTHLAGIRQWTYQGRPLFTYAGDLAPNDAYGMDADKDFKITYIARHFMPENVMEQRVIKIGYVLASSDGKTLYKRQGFIFQSGGGHSQRRGDTVRPAVGRDLGVNPRCQVDCSEEWRPFLAPTDAQAQGYWDVYTRPDGSKQWAYNGYALWTYDGDKQPGDILGQDTYDLFVGHDPDKVIDIGTPYDHPTALYWIAAIP